ncbi:MAG: hypothetical protein J6S00_05910 [Clostridia bacterium]|nr:hypothetical protein [Clostridia bacterium]
MKTIGASLILFVINLSLTCGIGIIDLQEYLTLLVYVVPILIVIAAVFVIYKSKPKQINLSFVILMAMFVVLAIVMCFVVYINGSQVSSMIAVCAFIAFFDIAPLLLVLWVYNCWRMTSNV